MLHVVLQLPNLLLMSRQLPFDANLLLLQDHLFVLVFVEVALQFVGIAGNGQQLGLFLDPVLLHVRALLGELRNGLAHVLQLGLLRPGHILVVADLRLQLRPLLVVFAIEAIHEELLLFNLMMPLSDLLFILLDEFFPLCQLIAQLLMSILQHLIVGLRIEAVHRHPGDLVQEILSFHLLCCDLFADLLHALSTVRSNPVAGGLFTHLLFDLAQDGGDLSGDVLHVAVQDFQGTRLLGDAGFVLLSFLGVLIHAFVERSVLIHESFSLLLQVCHLRLQVLRLFLIAISKRTELLVPLLFRADGGVKTADLVLNRQLRLALLLQSFLHVLQRFVATLHPNQGRPPLHHELLLLKLDGFHLPTRFT
mmetsp:Transcript_46592/g.74144  ORF Transcript_46592/g.74144 Transcript_46592/m.74144 type:complete len:364 (+) Transcript_46592:962-2053(+)